MGVGCRASSGARVEDYDAHADSMGLAREGQAGGFAPGGAEIVGDPEAVVARAEIEGAVVVGIDNEAFADGSAVFVAAHLEGHVGLLPGLAAIDGAEDSAVAGEALGVHATGNIDAVWIGGINGDAFAAETIPGFAGGPVGEWDPFFCV